MRLAPKDNLQRLTDLARSMPPWTEIWQLPALLLGVGLFTVGLYVAAPTPETPDFDGSAAEIAELLEQRRFDDARRRLDVYGEHLDEATPTQQAIYQMLVGDLVYLQQLDQGGDLPENHRRVLVHYQNAVDLGLELDPVHRRRWMATLVSLGRNAEAMAMLDRAEDLPAEMRSEVIREIIERRLAHETPIDQLASLIDRYFAEVAQTPSDREQLLRRIWAHGVVARGLIDARAPQAAIDYLTRARLIRLMNDAQRYAEAGKPVSLAPLQVLLAEASERVGEIDDARRAYRVAAEKLPAGDPLHADILVGRGRIALGVDDDPEAALELFQRVEREFPATPLFVDALVGAAEAQSRLGQLDLASRNLGRAVSEVAFRPAQDRRWRRQHRLVEAAIVSQFDHLFGMGKYDDALSFIQLLGPLYQRIGAPSDYALQLAAVHEKLGESLHEHADQAATGPAGGANPVDASTGRRLMAQQAAVHFEKAGDFYRQHADQVDRALDDTAHGESLWRSAHCYDRAQSWAKAIEAYSEFVATRLKDARLLRAAHQLGLALLADGQHQAAVDRFEPLVRTHPRSPEAFDSFVPLARAYVALERTADAVRLLRGVVDDHPVITPQSSHYRDALVELGRLRHRLGDYPTAIRRLAQAEQLYGDGELAPTIHFLLGDSYRQSIDVIAQRLDDVLTAADRMELQAERAERLEQAQSHFSAVVAAYRARPIGELSELERLRFRNASFYAADAAYDLGRYEQAIRLYDEAAKRWDQHPASLVALVQIVNAYCEMGAIDEARVANQRARWQLEQIPDEAFDDPTLPMSRQHWQDWLRWSSELDLFGPEDGRVSTEASADGESGP